MSHLNYFLEIIFLKINSNPPPRSTRCTRCSAPAAADERTRLPAGPAGQSAEGEELRRAGAHRRRPLSANQAALHALRLTADLARPFARPNTDRSRLATGHGGAAALLIVGTGRRLGRAWLEGLASIAVPRRTRCANYAAPEGMETRGSRVRRRSSRRRRKRGRAGLTVPYRALR